MGLPLYDNGKVILNVSTDILFADSTACEELLLRALLRLMCKLIDIDHTEDIISAQCQELLNGIEEDLDDWHSVAALSLRATRLPRESSSISGNEDLAYEHWYSSPTWTIATSYYHMARFILAVQRPLQNLQGLSMPQGLPNDLLRAVNQLQQVLSLHASAIISIARALPQESSRVRLIQPLYVAGRSLSLTGDRAALLKLLQDITTVTGVFIEYRTHDLRTEWGDA
jgi:hypothetical protein